MNPHRPTGPTLSLKTCAICGHVSARAAEHKCSNRPWSYATPPTKKSLPKGRNICSHGHAHGSKGESIACGPVHTAAAIAGWTVFRPGEPGIPCFKLPPDERGRPAYASVDWVLCDAAGTVVLGLDWKGEVKKSIRHDAKSWPRTKRIFEASTGAKCVELRTLNDIAAAVAGTEAP